MLAAKKRKEIQAREREEALKKKEAEEGDSNDQVQSRYVYIDNYICIYIDIYICKKIYTDGDKRVLVGFAHIVRLIPRRRMRVISQILICPTADRLPTLHLSKI